MIGHEPMGALTAYWAQNKNMSFEFFESIESTNAHARTTEFHDIFHLVVSETQTAGRGRGSNTWTSPKVGTSLLSSWCFKLSQAPSPVFSMRAGLALQKALAVTFPQVTFALKAPNDLYVKDKKIAGLLIEAIQGSRIIIGLGLNASSHPNINNSGCLKDFTDLTTTKWFEFLDNFFMELQLAVMHTEAGLTPEECAEMLTALNNYEGLQEKYVSVSPQGDLTTASKKISWQSL